MFWRKLNGSYYKYIAVNSFRQVHHETISNGKREYEFILTDGTKEFAVFDQIEWERLENNLGNGGQVLNA